MTKLSSNNFFLMCRSFAVLMGIGSAFIIFKLSAKKKKLIASLLAIIVGTIVGVISYWAAFYIIGVLVFIFVYAQPGSW